MDNTTEMFYSKSTCCMESMGAGTDPLQVSGTIAAGSAGKRRADTSCVLAKIYFPEQKYIAGYKPEEAHCQGTLFPELVRLYE